MTLAATCVFEVQTGGSDTNGGGYNSDAGTTDYSQQAAAELTITDAACAGNTTLTSAAQGGFTAQMVGSVVYLSSGPEWYEIIGYTSGTEVTIDRNGPSAAGMTANIGGCLATPGGLGKVIDAHGVNGMSAWLKTGTYTLSSGSANVSGGTVDIDPENQIKVEGYQTTRGDRGTAPVIDVGAQTGITVWRMDGTSGTTVTINIKVDGQGNANITGFQGATNGDVFYLCEAVDCTTGFNSGYRVKCTASSCGFVYGISVACLASGVPTGFFQGTFTNCVADGCNVGFYCNTGTTDGCTAYGCGLGFYVDIPGVLCNCYAGNCSGYGFDITGDDCALIACAAYNNTSGDYNGTPTVLDDFVGNAEFTGGQPLTDPGNGDYRPNATADAGALLRGAGIGVYGQTDNVDIGAVQHTDPAGGGGLLVHPGTSGGARG